MVKSFVEHINYVDNINEKCDGLAPIEAAAKAGHFEIVNILMPLTTDLEFSTWSEISCTCIKLKQFIQDKIKQFIVQTKIFEGGKNSFALLDFSLTSRLNQIP